MWAGGAYLMTNMNMEQTMPRTKPWMMPKSVLPKNVIQSTMYSLLVMRRRTSQSHSSMSSSVMKCSVAAKK